MTNFSGTAYLGDIGTSYQGTFHIDSTTGAPGGGGGALRLTNNNSLASPLGAVEIYGGSTANGRLELANNVSVSRALFFLDGEVAPWPTLRIFLM